MSITHSTQAQSWEAIKNDLGPRQIEVLELLARHPEGMTSWEIAANTARLVHAVRPRLTELKGLGIVAAIGTRYHRATERNEAVWIIAPRPTSPQFDSAGQGAFL